MNIKTSGTKTEHEIKLLQHFPKHNSHLNLHLHGNAHDPPPSPPALASLLHPSTLLHPPCPPDPSAP